MVRVVLKTKIMSRTYRQTSSYRLRRGERHSSKLRDGSYTNARHSCENNKGCSYCEENRLYKHNKQISLEEAVRLSDLDLIGYYHEDDGYFD